MSQTRRHYLPIAAPWREFTPDDRDTLRSPAYLMVGHGETRAPIGVLSRAAVLATTRHYAFALGGEAVYDEETDTLRQRAPGRQSDTFDHIPVPLPAWEAECTTCGMWAREHRWPLNMSCRNYQHPAVAKAVAALSEAFPEHVEGERDGWRIIYRNDAPAVVWDLAVKIAADTPQQEAKRHELGAALAAAGIAVTFPGDMFMVFFAERPADWSGPRYSVVGQDSAIGALFGGSQLVMDGFTGVHVLGVQTPTEAGRLCQRLNEVYEQQKARIAAGEEQAGAVMRVDLAEPA
ncbi:hypothetical protein [Streptomyces sp. 11x1]|uniref:hypothetical protein n=1 Tax=Streptomyces sp. 11x1 TaxID=3038642 RepID=UPI00292F40FC|nr:hypothetical protein [Streptomyces sp. 11x1]WNZ14890.1 hypothetical protein P8T65_46490 [Streptomyces sp. 11x1]